VDKFSLRTTDLYKYSPDTVPPIHAVSYHVATDKPPPKMATSSGQFLATIYNQSHLAERKHVARYWSINTAATAVPLSAHPSPLVITTKILAAAILGGRLFGGGVLPAQYCPCDPNLYDTRRMLCQKILHKVLIWGALQIQDRSPQSRNGRPVESCNT